MSLLNVLLSNALMAGLLALVVHGVTRRLQRPALTHSLWVLVLIKLITPPFYIIPLLPAPAVVPVAKELSMKPPEPAPLTVMAQELPAAVSPLEPGQPQPIVAPQAEPTLPPALPVTVMAEPAAGPVYHGPAAPVETAVASRRMPLPQLLGGIWLLGAVTLGGWMIWRIHSFQRLVNRGHAEGGWLQELVDQHAATLKLRRVPRAWLLAQNVSPMLWPLGRQARLIFPEALLHRLDEPSLSTLLLHELAHWTRRDHWVRFLELGVQCLYWWHPVVWWASRELHYAEEECCDALVIQTLDNSEKIYASALVQTLAWLSSPRTILPPVASGIGQMDLLKHRLTRIMQGRGASRLSLWARLLVIVAGLVLLPVLPMWTVAEDTSIVGEEKSAAGVAPTAEAAPAGRQPFDFSGALGQLEPTKFEPQPVPLSPLDEEVRSLSMSRDGKLLAVGHGRWTTTGTVRLWNFPDRQNLLTIREKKGIASVALTPDGKYLAWCNWENAIKVIDTATHKEIAHLVPGAAVARLDFSPDGRTLAAASEDARIRLWSTDTFEEITGVKFEGKLFRFQFVRFSPDGQKLAACGGSFEQPTHGKLIVWDVGTGRVKDQVELSQIPIGGVAWSSDGNYLAANSFNGQVTVMNGGDGRQMFQFTMRGAESVCFSPGNSVLAATGQDGSVQLWDVANATEIRRMTGHRQTVIDSLFTPDGSLLLTGGMDQQLNIWDAKTGQLTGNLNAVDAIPDPPEAILSVAWSPEKNLFATSHEGGEVRLRNAENGSVVRVLAGHSDIVNALAFSPDGQRLLTGSFDNTARLWDVATGQELAVLKGHTSWVFAVTFSADGTTLATGGYDKKILLWNAKSFEQIGELTGHTANVRSLVFTPNGKQLVSGSGDRTAIVWDLAAKLPMHVLKGHQGAIRDGSLRPDGLQFATASEDHTVKIWDMTTGQELRTLTGHTDMVRTVSYSPKGQSLVSGGYDNQLIVWDPDTGTARQTLTGHADVISDAVWAPDASGLLSVSYDRSFKFWRAIAPQVPPLQTLHGYGDSARFAIFSRVHQLLITGGHEWEMKFYDLKTGQELEAVKMGSGLTSAALSPDESLLFTAGWSKEVSLWDMKTRKLIRQFQAHDDHVNDLSLTPDGQQLITCSFDKTAKIWDVSDPRQEKLLQTYTHTLPVSSGAISQDGKLLVLGTGSWKDWQIPGLVQLIDLENRREIRTLKDTQHEVKRVKISPDGKTIAGTGAMGYCYVWDRETGKMLQWLKLETPVVAIHYLTSDVIATGHLQGQLGLWDWKTQTSRVHYTGHTDMVSALDLSADGTILSSSSRDGLIHLWPLSDHPQSGSLAALVRDWKITKPASSQPAR